MPPSPSRPSAPEALRSLLAGDGLRVMPCCFDALSTRLVERAGFPLTLLESAAWAMQEALAALAAGAPPAPDRRLRFDALRELVGFPAYGLTARRYASED